MNRILNDFQRLSSENKMSQLNSTKFNNSIVTTIEEAGPFWIAEEYHQKYIRKKKQSSFF